MSHELRAAKRLSSEILIEEVGLDGRGRYHVALNLSSVGAMLMSGSPLEEGKRYLWLRFDIPGCNDFVPVLAEVVYEKRMGQVFYRGVRYKHILSQHQQELVTYLDLISSPQEVEHG